MFISIFLKIFLLKLISFFILEKKDYHKYIFKN